MAEAVPAADLPALVGREFEPSPWFAIDQARVDAFADATCDHQFIHVDPERAARTPFGGTIAHGYLTLSLLPHLTAQSMPRVPELAMAVNYGLDRLRFVQPVRVGNRVRARSSCLEAQERQPGQWLLRYRVTVDIEHQEKPALIADTLVLYVIGAAEPARKENPGNA